MGFYEQISRYYDYIFPIDEPQLTFLKDCAGHPPKRILDVACGSGGYSIELSRTGHEVFAVDLDREMIELARKKAEAQGLNVKAFMADMLNLGDVINQSVHFVFCIGNSIVHLGGVKEISEAIRQMYNLLLEGGVLALQIINFDRVFKYGINALPSIENDDVGLRFIRNYEYDEIKGLMRFNTILTLNGGKERYENSVPLYPLRSSELIRLLEDVGFKDVELFGGFGYKPYNDEAFLLVAKAVK